MHCIIYSFQVQDGKEHLFLQSWSMVTAAYMEHAGSLGSRLHKNGPGEYIAYAQWPSKEARQKAALPEEIQNGPLAVMHSSCASIDVLYELTPIAGELMSPDTGQA